MDKWRVVSIQLQPTKKAAKKVYQICIKERERGFVGDGLEYRIIILFLLLYNILPMALLYTMYRDRGSIKFERKMLLSLSSPERMGGEEENRISD